ncbi:MAG: phytanoyl-CoA dioxygenase family protein [Pseudomonadota bacterium]
MNAPALPNRADIPPRPIFPEGSSGIRTTRLADTSLLDEVQGVVAYYFPRDTQYYVDMEPDAYRGLIFAAQEELNRRQITRRLAEDRRDVICEVLDTQRPMIQTNIYMRGTRPSVLGIQENIGWHRESFYGPDMDQAINLWVPILNVSAENVMRYIPDSHLIPDAEISTHSEADDSVQRFSAGHKIGLLYAPKEITGGVELNVSKPFCVLPGEVAIFAGHLIHGAAENLSDKIRFSMDFRLIAEESLSSAKEHFASGKSYFESV